MRASVKSRSKVRKGLLRTRHRPAPEFSNKVVAAQIAETYRNLEGRGVLTGRAGKVSARIDRGLLSAAARKAGSRNTTAVMQAALAAFVAPDPFVVWLLSGKDRLPPGFELAI